MRAMILAAGRGERMGMLTRDRPKPLLTCNGFSLIEYSIYALRQAGIVEIVINVCYEADQIKIALGNGEKYGVSITYSTETHALETGGGIYQALPFLGSAPFLVISSDIVTAYPLTSLPPEPAGLAHLVLVDNPPYHPNGDFSLQKGEVRPANKAEGTLTFANIGIYRPELFAACSAGRFRLGDVFRQQLGKGTLTGEYYQGVWQNIGTPEGLAQLGGSAFTFLPKPTDLPLG